MKDLLDGWGLTAAVFLPLVGAAVMMVIPKAEETLHKVVALVTSLAVLRRSASRSLANFDYDRRGTLQFVHRQGVDRRHQQPLHRRRRRHLAAAAAADACSSSRW